ncbi:FUSC family protein [Clostridium paraputrificum]|uniref:FUSC family protein n=1 Tax=Clostridium paraputrificum TaxID=29363 RepID=UPI003D34E4BF
MNKIELPKIGLRNIKTALAVFICMILFQLSGGKNPFYACIAAVICMKDTVESTFTMGKNRLIGTLLGGLLGVIAIYLIGLIPILHAANPLLTAIGIVLAIYCCNLINKPGAVTICCIVFIGIMINYDGPTSYSYAIGRSIDTSIGIIIAILINKYINPPEENNIKEEVIEELTTMDNEINDDKKTSV